MTCSIFPEGTMPIGRLDEKSEGLLLLTTDGRVSELARSKQVENEYYVQVDGLITHKAIDLLTKGVDITVPGGRYTTLPCKARRLGESPELIFPPVVNRSPRHGPSSWLTITLTEGKFRQIRKMTAAVGFPSLRLIRIRIGPIHLENLAAGEVTEIESIHV